MPAKRRRPKRRASEAAEIEAWRMTFRGGYDFLGDLEDFGIHERAMSREDFRSAAAETWSRLGETYLAEPDPNAAGLTPWALEEFGDPRSATCR